jgi:hypothetical protein
MRRTAAAERQKRQKKGETGDAKCRQHGRAEEAKRATAVEMTAQATAVMTAAMSMRAVQGGTKRGF